MVCITHILTSFSHIIGLAVMAKNSLSTWGLRPLLPAHVLLTRLPQNISTLRSLKMNVTFTLP